MINNTEHIKQHKKLHKALSELMEDFILNTKNHADNTMLDSFIAWSHKQTIKPNHSEDTCREQ